MDTKFDFIMSVNNKKGNHSPIHSHNYYELVYYISGSGISYILDEPFTYSSNSYSIITPGSVHYEIAHELSDIIFIGFEYNGQSKLQNNVLHDNEELTIFKYLLDIKDEFTNRKFMYNEKMNLLMGELLIEMLRNPIIENDYKQSSGLTNIMNYLSKNCTLNINYQKVAELSGYSYDWFRHYFKENVGMSPKQYVISQRISLAKKMLIETDHSISYISSECGFSSASKFIEVFKKNASITPVEFRRMISENKVN